MVPGSLSCKSVPEIDHLCAFGSHPDNADELGGGGHLWRLARRPHHVLGRHGRQVSGREYTHSGPICLSFCVVFLGTPQWQLLTDQADGDDF